MKIPCVLVLLVVSILAFNADAVKTIDISVKLRGSYNAADLLETFTYIKDEFQKAVPQSIVASNSPFTLDVNNVKEGDDFKVTVTAKFDLVPSLGAGAGALAENAAVPLLILAAQLQATQEAFIKAMLTAGVPYVDKTLTVNGVVTSVEGWGFYGIKIKVTATDLSAAKQLGPKMLQAMKTVFAKSGDTRGFGTVFTPTLTLFRRSLAATEFLVIGVITGTTTEMSDTKTAAESTTSQKALYEACTAEGVQFVPNSLKVNNQAAAYTTPTAATPAAAPATSPTPNTGVTSALTVTALTLMYMVL